MNPTSIQPFGVKKHHERHKVMRWVRIIGQALSLRPNPTSVPLPPNMSAKTTAARLRDAIAAFCLHGWDNTYFTREQLVACRSNLFVDEMEDSVTIRWKDEERLPTPTLEPMADVWFAVETDNEEVMTALAVLAANHVLPGPVLIKTSTSFPLQLEDTHDVAVQKQPNGYLLC